VCIEREKRGEMTEKGRKLSDQKERRGRRGGVLEVKRRRLARSGAMGLIAKLGEERGVLVQGVRWAATRGGHKDLPQRRGERYSLGKEQGGGAAEGVIKGKTEAVA